MNEYDGTYLSTIKKQYPGVVERAMQLMLEGTRFTDLAVIVAGLDLKKDVRADHVAPLSEIVRMDGPAWAASEGVKSFSGKEVSDG